MGAAAASGGIERKRAPPPPLENRPLPWLAPLLLLIGLFYLYPLIDVVRLSFTNISSIGGPYRYSLASFANLLLSVDFAEMARITAIFVAASVAGQLLLGLLIAALLIAGERRGLPGATLVRSVVLIGWILPGVVVGIVWKLMLDESPSGILAYLLSLLGVRDPVFLSAAGPALFWVIIANVWRGTAFSMILQYAGMKTIPPELYEAAILDGAGSWQQFLYLTLPSLRRIILINLMLITTATLNTFDMIVSLTGGGPGRATEVVALFIYNAVFVQFSIGRGAAAAVLLALFGVALMVGYFRLFFADDGETA
jgi:multiple sugar transport system permease protein